jgi:hypothetical protein
MEININDLPNEIEKFFYLDEIKNLKKLNKYDTESISESIFNFDVNTNTYSDTETNSNTDTNSEINDEIEYDSDIDYYIKKKIKNF